MPLYDRQLETAPTYKYYEVTPEDADLPNGLCLALFVGGEGNLVVVNSDGDDVTINSGSSQYHPIRTRRVKSATATGIIALYED